MARYAGMGLIPSLAQWVKGLGVAAARIQSLAQEVPYALGEVLKRKKKKNIHFLACALRPVRPLLFGCHSLCEHPALVHGQAPGSADGCPLPCGISPVEVKTGP